MADFAHLPIGIGVSRLLCKSLFLAVIWMMIIALAGVSLAEPMADAESMRQASGPELKSSTPGLPLIFERNIGQAPLGVKFLSHGNDSLLLITSDAAILHLAVSRRPRADHAMRANPATVRIRMVGANPDAPVEGQAPLGAHINYFIGRDPSRWHSNIPAFGVVTVHDAWPGIDVEYRRDSHQSFGAVECAFIVRPGADPSIIRLAFAGIDHIRRLSDGGLALETGGREIRFNDLHVFEQRANGLREIKARFAIRSNPQSKEPQVQFRLARRDARAPLIIDPTLIFSSFIGGSGETSAGAVNYGTGDSANAIALDGSGNEYLTGSTSSLDFPGNDSKLFAGCPLVGACNPAFIAKLDGRTGAVVYSTIIGGGFDANPNTGFGDAGVGIAVDNAGEAYVAGNTSSSVFPTTSGAYITNNVGGGLTGFVLKLSSDGSSLEFSTLMGLNGGFATVAAIAIDGSGNAYVAGDDLTSSYAAILNSAGSNVTYSFFFAYSAANAIAISPSGLIFLGGAAQSNEFLTTANAFRQSCARCTKQKPAFVAVLNPSLGSTNASVVYSTVLGGSVTGDTVNAMAADADGRVWVAGAAGVGRFVARSQYGVKTCSGPCGTKAFVALIDPSKSGAASLPYSAAIAGNGTDAANAIAVDTTGTAYVGGRTSSTNFPVTKEAVQRTYTTCKGCARYRAAGFITVLRPHQRLLYSTYLGGAKVAPATNAKGSYVAEPDAVNALAVDSFGVIHAAGLTYSSAFPVTANAEQPTCKACQNLDASAFTVRINPLAITAALALEYSSYLGGSGPHFFGDTVKSVATDSAGAIYLAGTTTSSDFPVTAGAFDVNCPECVGLTDAGYVSVRFNGFVAKLDPNAPSGSQLIYATYLGGSAPFASDDLSVSSSATGIAVDSTGEVYVVGTTNTPNFPVTSSAFQGSCGTVCAPTFFSKLDASGSDLTYSTYLGGNRVDTPVGVAIDPHGKALIAGFTSSTDFPTTPGALQSSCIPCDATSVLSYGSFVSEIDPATSGSASLVYSTYLNGSGHLNGNGSIAGDAIAAITTDGAGDAVVAGRATSTDFPISANAYQTAITAGNIDSGFVTVVNPAASGAAQLEYSTFLNSGNPLAVQVDGNGDLFVGGNEATLGLPVTPNSFITACALHRCPNGFIVELNPLLAPANQLVYGTYLGGTTPFGGTDSVTALGLDGMGRIYAAGNTSSSDFPVSADAAQSTCLACALNGGGNAFFTVLNPTASGSSELVYSTFLGGSVEDSATGLALGPLGLVALGGSTYSSDFPTTANALETTCPACRNPNIQNFLNGDGFVAAFQF
jgi:hypothetical protein